MVSHERNKPISYPIASSPGKIGSSVCYLYSVVSVLVSKNKTQCQLSLETTVPEASHGKKLRFEARIATQ